MADPILDGDAPEGAKLYQKMLDAGGSQANVDAYRADMSRKMMDAGAKPTDVLKYWGLDKPEPDLSGMTSSVKDNIGQLAPEDHTRIASNTFEQFAAGLGMSASSLLIHAPTVKPIENPGLFQKIVAAAGQEVGDLPFQIVGGALGAPVGAAAGAGIGAVGGPAGAASGAAIGANIGMGAGAAALPAAMRSTLMDMYGSKGGPFTWSDVWAHMTHVIGDTAKAAAAGAVGGAVVGPLGGAVEKAAAPMLSPAAATIAGKTAGLVGFSEAATATGAALDGRVPDRDEQIVGATLAIGFGAAAAFKGATNRVVTKPAGDLVAKNLSDIYVDTGLRPVEVGKVAAQDVAVREEVLAPTNADGQRVTPVLDAMRKSEPEPYKQIEGPKSGETPAEGAEPPPPPPPTGRELLAPPKAEPEVVTSRMLTVQGDPGTWEPPNSVEVIPPGGGEPPPPEKPALPGPEEPDKRNEFIKNNDYRKQVIDDILAPAPKGENPFFRGWDGVRSYLAKFQSALTPAVELDKELNLLGPHTEEGQIKAPGNLGIEDMMRMTFGSSARTNYMLRFGGLIPGEGTFDETGRPAVLDAFARVKTDGGNTQDFYRYLLAARTVEKAAQGIDTGIPLDVAAAHIADPANIRMYETAAHILTRAKDGFIDYGTASGLWSEDRANAMKNLNQYHIVFRRVMDPDYPSGPSKGLIGSPLKKMEGSQRQILDPGKADLDNMHSIIAMADRNRAIGNIIGLIRLKTGSQVGNMPFARSGTPITDVEVKDITDTIHMEQVPLGEFGIDVSKVMQGELLDENGKPIIGPAKEAATPFLAYRSLSKVIGPNDFIYLDNGVPQVWRAADARVAQLVRIQSAAHNPNILASVARWTANLSRYGITMDPTFFVRALSHGQLAASIAAENPRAPLMDFFEGMPQALRDMTGLDVSETFRLFQRTGGGTALSDMDKLYNEEGLSIMSQEPKGFMSRLWNVAKSPISAMQTLQHTLHTASQYGNFKQGLRNGNLPIKAANQAATAYLDFREGFASSAVQEFSRWVPFMNVGFKDIEQMGRAFQTGAKRTAALGFMTLTIPAVILAVLNNTADRDLPEAQKYANIPQYIKDSHFILPPSQTGYRVMWPKPYVANFLFTALPERFVDWWAGNDPKGFDNVAGSFARSFLPPVIPAITQGGIEEATNTKLVSGAPLVPDSLMALSNYKRYGPNTTKAGQAAGRLLGEPGLGLTTNAVSPIVLDNYFKTLGGTLPYELMHAIDGHFAPSGTHNQGFLHDMVTRTFFLTTKDYTPQPITDLWDKIKEFKEAHADLYHTARAGETLDTMPDQQRMMAMVRVNGIEKGLVGANKMIQGINAMPDDKMAPNEKQKSVDAIMEPLVVMAKQALTQFKDIEAQAKAAHP